VKERVEQRGLAPGDEWRVSADGDRIALSREEGLAERRRRAIRQVAGSLAGVYEHAPDELKVPASAYSEDLVGPAGRDRTVP